MKIIKVASIRLKDVCEIKTNFPDADFWLQRKGDVKSLGRPSKEYNNENIGIKVVRTDVLDPNYLYYLFMHLHGTGQFEQLAKGALRLQHISIEDIRNIPLG